MTPLQMTGGRGASQRLGIFDVHKAASSVASEPNTISTGPTGLSRLVSKHPMNRPGVVKGNKKGSTHNASEKRHCTGPKVRPKMLPK